MHDEANFDEVAGAVGMGLVASNVVLAIAKLTRSDPLDDRDRKALERARAVLDGFSHKGGLPLADGLHQLEGSSAIDALQAVELNIGGESVEDFATKLSHELTAVIAGEPLEGHWEALDQVKALFSAIGDAEVMRVTNISRASHDVPPWLTPETSRT